MNEEKSYPLKWAFRLLRVICPPHMLEEIEGDVLQRYGRDVKKAGARKAKQKMALNIIRFLRPGILFRHSFNATSSPLNMIANHVKVAGRVMWRNKSFSLTNVGGLALGITGALLLYIWIDRESGFDKFHQDYERIYKAWNKTKIDGTITCWDQTPRVLSEALAQEFTAIEMSASFAQYNDSFIFSAGDTKLTKNRGSFTDPDFFRIFSFPLMKGNAQTVFKNPESIVLTASFAKDLFGDRDAFGQTVVVGQGGEHFSVVVTGVLKDLPANTDFHFEYLLPFQLLEQHSGKDDGWLGNSVETWVKLRKGSDASVLNDQVAGIVKKHARSENAVEIFLYPLESMRLYSRFENGVVAGGRIEIMRMMGILGICLVAIACINFINLSTARAQKRSKEVGVRKASGAVRFSLVFQFICESSLLALIAGVISVAAAFLLLPAFSRLIGLQMEIDFQNIVFWVKAFGAILMIGVLAGAYPAFYLSSFQPAKVLKGTGISFSNRNWLRKMLVVVQFGFATTMIFSVLVIYRQISFVQSRETGYAKDHLIYHPLNGDLLKNYNAYRHDLLESGLVESVTRTGSPITEGWSNTYSLDWEGKDPLSKIVVDRFNVDQDITKTAGLTLVAGRDMDIDKYASDSSAILLNEAAVKLMGFKNPVGEIVRDGRVSGHVVGVVKDFILTSPHLRIKPMVMQAGSPGGFSTVHIRLRDAQSTTESIAAMSKIFAKYNPGYPFDYSFVDQAYQKKFAGLETTMTITTVFSSLVVAIACLGLFGLSTYVIESRRKELGIRKVLGGSVLNITRLLCMSTVRPILLAFVLFAPQGWLSMQWWLGTFDYKIQLSVWMMFAAAGCLLFIALATIISQTFRAASMNPVNGLRSE